MDKRIKLVFFIFISTAIFSYNPEDRTADAMVLAKKYYLKKNWPGIIKISRDLLSWGEKAYVEKCIQMAEPIVVAKNSYTGALQIADLYDKLEKKQKYEYWMKVYQRMMDERKRKWKKN